MTPEQAEKLQEHVQEIFSGIEQAVREQMQQHVMPEVGIFLSQQVQEQQKDENASSKASLEK
jgi:hypothetical protein